jgi:hypothetical protein
VIKMYNFSRGTSFTLTTCDSSSSQRKINMISTWSTYKKHTYQINEEKLIMMTIKGLGKENEHKGIQNNLKNRLR